MLIERSLACSCGLSLTFLQVISKLSFHFYTAPPTGPPNHRTAATKAGLVPKGSQNNAFALQLWKLLSDALAFWVLGIALLATLRPSGSTDPLQEHVLAQILLIWDELSHHSW